MKPPSHIAQRSRGIISAWMAILMIVIIGFIGLSIDTAHVVRTRHQLQIVADAASLAGAAQLFNGVDLARDAATRLALANTVYSSSHLLEWNDINALDGDIVIGRYNRIDSIFTATLNGPNAVKVVARRAAASPNGQLPLIFGQIFGFATIDVSRFSIAMMQGGTGHGLIGLNPSARCAVEISGSATLNLDGGAVQVNSESPCAMCANGSATIIAPEIDSSGGICFKGNVTFDGIENPDAPAIPDPLALLPDPTYDTSVDLGTVRLTSGPLTISPGYYSGGITSVGGDLVLESGIYILDGDGFQIGGNTNLLADGVMIYVIGTGYVQIDGTGSITLRPPDPEIDTFFEADVFEGVAIFQARDNTNDSTIIGTGLLDIEGTLYFPDGHLRLGGTGSGFGSQLIADTIEIFGTGDIFIEYDGRDPATGYETFLVK